MTIGDQKYALSSDFAFAVLLLSDHCFPPETTVCQRLVLTVVLTKWHI